MSTKHKSTSNAGKALAIAGLFAVPLAASAQTAPASDPAAPTAAELDQRIKVLERKLEIAKDDAAAAAAAAPAVKASPSGFSLASNNGTTVIKFKAVFDADNRYFFNDLQPSGGTALLARGTDQTLIRLARPYVEGTLGGLVDFRLMPDFAGGKVVLQDAFGAVKFKPYFVLTAGKFKSPVGLERLQSDTDLRFIERALPDRLIPNRDIGVQLSGELLPGVLTYQVAYLNGVIDGGSTDNTSNVPAAAVDGDTNNSKDIAVRLFANPFTNSQAFVLRGLGVGVGASRGTLHGYIDTSGTYSLLTSYKTTGQQTFFSYRAATSTTGATFADGLRQRISPQAYYYYGPFGLLTEYVVSKTEVRRQNNANTAILRGTLANTAWQVQAGVFLTGEDEGYKFPVPKHPYQVGKPGWGAVELVARYSVLDIDDAAFAGGANSFSDPTRSASRAKAWAVGVNWELTANFKLIANYENTSFDGGATVAAGGDSPTEKLLVTRFQFAY